MSDLESCFTRFRRSAFRLETLPHYAVDADDARLAAFRDRRPLPDRSVRTSPWLRRVALTTAKGKSWQRVHVMNPQLSEYERFELIAYVESAAAGEEIRIAERGSSADLDLLRVDFWLFDADTRRPFAALMSYDADGHYLDSAVTADPATVRRCMVERDLALRHAVPLNAYLAARRTEIGAG